MADVKISDMTTLANMDNADLVPVVHALANFKVTRQTLLSAGVGEPIQIFGAGSVLTLTATGDSTLTVAAGQLLELTDTVTVFFGKDASGNVAIRSTPGGDIQIQSGAVGTMSIGAGGTTLHIFSTGQAYLQTPAGEGFAILIGSQSSLNLDSSGFIELFPKIGFNVFVGDYPNNYLSVDNPAVAGAGAHVVKIGTTGTYTMTKNVTNVFTVSAAGAIALAAVAGQTFSLLANAGGFTISAVGLLVFPLTVNFTQDCQARHFGGLLATPGIAAGTGLGTGPTLAIVGTDTCGQITVTVGTLPANAATLFTVTFTSNFGASPFVCFSPGNANAAIIAAANAVYVQPGTLSFRLVSAGKLTVGAQFIWYYHVLGI